MRKVSVETGLDPIKQRLAERGYEVVAMENCYSAVEAVIYSGEAMVDSVCTHGPEGTMLINAQGLTPDAVVDRLDNL
jgi:hypothetical protein